MGGVGQRVKPSVLHLQGFRHPPIAVSSAASIISCGRLPLALWPMVSADSLNLDVLEFISAHLDQHDLFHLSLVSRNFVAAATPILYRSIGYHFSQSANPALRVSLVRTSSSRCRESDHRRVAYVGFRHNLAASCAGRTHPSHPYVPMLLSRSRSHAQKCSRVNACI